MEKRESLNNEPKISRLEKINEDYPLVYLAGLIIGIVLFIPSIYLAHKHQLTGFQLRIFRDLNNISGKFKTPAVLLTEGLGAGYPIAACVIIAALYKRYRLAWRFFFTSAAAGVLLEIGKKIAKEPRPAVLLNGHLNVRATETGLTSFPSGHETIATALALTLWIVLPKKWRWLSVLWIIVVAISRIYVGDHTPNDIVGGFAIGLIVVSAIMLLPLKVAKLFRLDDDKKSLLEKGF